MNTLLFLGGIGLPEILVIALVVLLLFGGKKIPELMRGLGKGVKNFKEGMNGYYITNGYAIPITWEKEDDYALTKYYDPNGNEIVLNTGKTMICIVEDTAEDSLTIN